MKDKMLPVLFVGGLVVGLGAGYGIGKSSSEKVNKASMSSKMSKTTDTAKSASATPAAPSLSLSDTTTGCTMSDDSAPKTESTTENMLSLDGKVYTYSQIPSEIKTRLYDTDNRSYQQKVSFLQDLAVRMALSKSTSLENLPRLADLLPKATISEDEMKQFYENSKAQMPPNMTYESVKPRIESYLQSQRVSQQFQLEVSKLKDSGRMKILLTEPTAPEVNLDTSNYPTLGNKDAEHTLIEISDYTCGHCQAVHPQVKEVLKEMGDKIKFVQINLALRPTGKSGTFVRGAACAQIQNPDKFWDFHNKTFDKLAAEPHDHSHGTDGGHKHDAGEDLQTLLEIAKTVGYDEAAFTKCVNGDESKEVMEETIKMVTSFGINSTPTFFLNNKRLTLDRAGLKATLSKHIQ